MGQVSKPLTQRMAELEDKLHWLESIENKIDRLGELFTGEEGNTLQPLTPSKQGRPDLNAYEMTFSIPKKAAEKLQETALKRKSTLQDLVAVALDRWMREEKLGTFYSDDREGWGAKK